MQPRRFKYITPIAGVSVTILSFIVGLYFNFSAETYWLATLISVIITVSLTFIELNLDDRINRLETNLHDKINHLEETTKQNFMQNSHIFETMENLHDEDIKRQVLALLDGLKKGEVPAFMASSLTRKLMSSTTSSCVSIYPIRKISEIHDWIDHSRHRSWLQFNFDAVDRGVKVERTFIMNRKEICPDGKWEEKAFRVLEEQSKRGINIHIIWVEDLEKSTTHVNLEQTFTILDENIIIVYEGKGNNRIYRFPSAKIQEFNDIWKEHTKFFVPFQSP